MSEDVVAVGKRGLEELWGADALPVAKLQKQESTGFGDWSTAGAGMDTKELTLEELQVFVGEWCLNVESIGKIEQLSPEVLKVVIRDFAPSGAETDWNAKFLEHASRVERAFNDGVVAGASYLLAVNSGASGQPAAAAETMRRPSPATAAQMFAQQTEPPLILEEVQAFITQWGLNQTSIEKVEGLPAAALTAVVRGFAPDGDEHDWNEKFLEYTSSVETALAIGVLNRHASPAETRKQRSNIAMQMLLTKKNASKTSQTQGPAARHKDASMPTIEEVQTFVNNWSLNSDSITKLEHLSPDGLKVVIREFAPQGDNVDWNGKFIAYASSVERAIVNDAMNQSAVPASARQHTQNMALQMLRGRSTMGKGQMHGVFPLAGATGVAPQQRLDRMPTVEEVQAFVDRWGLKTESIEKIEILPPEALNIAMRDFAPYDDADDCNAKFVTFVSHLERRFSNSSG